jgi:hypothetical protein
VKTCAQNHDGQGTPVATDADRTHGRHFMTEARRIQAPKSKKTGKEEEEIHGPGSSSISEDAKKRKLQELDEFMEDVLQKTGEEFLDEFRQVEGE